MMIGSVSFVGMNVREWYMHVSVWECPVYMYDSIRNVLPPLGEFKVFFKTKN